MVKRKKVTTIKVVYRICKQCDLEETWFGRSGETADTGRIQVLRKDFANERLAGEWISEHWEEYASTPDTAVFVAPFFIKGT